MSDGHVPIALLAATAGVSALAAAGMTAAWFRSRAAAASPAGGCGATGCSCVVTVGRADMDMQHCKADPFDALPRAGYLSWDDYFIALAFLSAQRSKDPNKQVGAVLVSQDNIILGIGYNGFPRGCPDSQLPWAKRSRNGDVLATKYPYVCHAEMNAVLNKNTASLAGAVRGFPLTILSTLLCVSGGIGGQHSDCCHILIELSGRGCCVPMQNAQKIYVTMFPCNECAKLLIQAGISEVIYFESKDTTAATGTREPAAAHSGMQPDQAYAASQRMLAMTGVRLRHYRPKHQLSIRLGLKEHAATAPSGSSKGGGG